MKLGIIIPWREQPSRIEAFNHVFAWYQTNFPDTKIYIPDHPGEMWLPSHTRNDGVRMAEADGCDIVIHADADTLTNIDSLREAIEAAYKDGLMHNPYNSFIYLNDIGTKICLKNKQTSKFYGRPMDVCWGIVVTKISTWWELGGMDEKFMGWGKEDDAMNYAHKIIKQSDFVKHSGIGFSFNHSRQTIDVKIKEKFKDNVELSQKYREIKDPEQLLAFIKS